MAISPLERSFSYVVNPSYQKGIYELTISANTDKGISHATTIL